MPLLMTLKISNKITYIFKNTINREQIIISAYNEEFPPDFQN